MAPDTPGWSTIVLSGGRSRRMGHDKARATLAGRSLLDLAISSVPNDVPCIVVGPWAPSTREVVHVIEPLPDGGPVAGIACGLEHVRSDIVVVLAVDMPFVGGILASLADDLAGVDASVDGLVAIDAQGHRQQLVAAYRRPALLRALADMGSPRDRAVRELQDSMEMRDVPLAADDPLTLGDIDTPDDLARARRSLRQQVTAGGGSTMDDWVTAASAVLGIETTVDVDDILDLAREAAHGVERPAAPVTTYLMGVAVGQGMASREAAERLAALARDWPSPA